jgi:type IV pilus assembly protein PilO
MAMNLNLKNVPWHTQLGLLAGTAVAAVGAFWYFYAQPTQASIDMRREELASMRRDVDRGLATAKQLPEFRRGVAGLQSELDRLRTVLPQERDVSDLLRRVQAMATQSNLVIRGFKPQAVTTHELHAEWPIGLQLEGSYHDLGAFFDRISKFPRIINVKGITIRGKDEQTGGSTITAECTAMTFVMVDPPPAQPEAAAGRGARGRGGRGAAPARGRGAARGA